MMKKLIAMIMVMVIALNIPVQSESQQAEAAVPRITVAEFAQALTQELGMEVAERNGTDGALAALIQAGVIKAGDFSSYDAKLTRGDMLILLNRADEYLNKTSVDDKLVKHILEKRISDISEAADNKKEDIAKGFSKGFMKGYSNGSYAPNRNLKLTSKVTKAGALSSLKLLKDKKLRAKMSPDGQLLRTTKLPNNAYMYPYILASFPNSYYEGKLRFEGVTMRIGGVLTKMKSPKDYTYPKDVAEAELQGIKDFNEAKESYMEMWMDKAYTHVWNVFNVDYRTIDDEWKNTVLQTDASYANDPDYVKNYLNQYVKEMIDNKTIVECDKIALDGSSLYYYNDQYYIRCYVHYRIVSTNVKNNYPLDKLDGKVWGPYNCVFYTRASFVDYFNMKEGKWVSGIFDVGIAQGDNWDNGSLYGVCDTDWSPYLYRSIER